MDRQKTKILSRVLAIILCLACLFASFSVFFKTITGNSEDVTSITITFTQGSDCQLTASTTTIFSDVTASVDTNASGCLVVPETYFDIGDGYTASSSETKIAVSIAVSSTMTSNASTYILDCETFYLYNTDENVKASSWYSFTGWHIKGADDKIPEQTVFQPGDVITPDILSKYASGDSLTLEALWGKCYFIQNAYTSMVYSNTLSGSEGYYELDESSSSGVTGASDDNAGTDPAAPKATIDGVYSTLRSGSTSTTPHRDYDAYATVIMLTGDLDYYKDSSRSTSGAYVYYRYYGYGADTSSTVNNGVNANQEYVSATYKSLQATRTYNSADKTATITYTSSTRGTKYSYNYKGHGSYNFAYGNFRFDNILFKRIDSSLYGGSYTSEFQLYYPDGDTGVHYFETTARYNVYVNDSGTTVYITASSSTSECSAFSVFRTADHQYIVLNGGQISSLEMYWSSATENIDRYWYIGRLAAVNNYITCGSTSTDLSIVNTRYGDWHLTVTGGKIGFITGSSASMYSTSVGNRYINVYGDGSDHVVNSTLDKYEYSPYITNLYGGGRTARLFGDVTVTAIACKNLINVYGGGRDYSATTYGDVTLNLTNCSVSNSVYGGGQYANVEEVPSTYTVYTYENEAVKSTPDQAITSLSSSLTANSGGTVTVNISGTTIGTNNGGSVYGSGMGQTQQISTSTVLESHTLTNSEITNSSTSYYYPTDWTTEPTFPSYDSSTGYVLIGSYKYITWSSASPTSVNFRRYDFYAYLSLATVENVVINITDDSKVNGDVYGGGSIAQVLGSTTVNITDSTVTGTVYGGGDGATTPDTVKIYKSASGSDSKSWTYSVTGYNTSTNVPTEVTFVKGYNDLTDLLELGEFTWSNGSTLEDGGAALKASGIDKTNNLLYSANMSGLGSVIGSTTVNISGKSTVDTVYGGGNEGAVGVNTTVNISSTTNGSPNITTLYGGGNQGAVTGNITVNIEGGTIGTVYGGCNAADVGGNITVEVTGGTIGTLYGGNNASGEITGAISVTVSGSSTEITTLYGGGNLAAYTADNTSVTITVSDGSVGTIYGGGLSADVSTTSVTLSGGSVTGSVYGGGYEGAVTTASVTASGATITTNIYGGGYEGAAVTTSVTVSGGSAVNVFGGGYNGAVSGNSTVAVSGGTISGDIYGGGENANVAGTTEVTVSDGTITGSVYGGGYAGDIGTDTTASSTTVTVTGGSIANVYGGGYNGSVYGTTAVSIADTASTTTISGSVYGAGYGESTRVTEGTTVTVDLSYKFEANEALTDTSSTTSGETKTTITGDTDYTSVIEGSVYGGGNLGTVGVGTIDTSTNTATITTAAATVVNIVSGYIEGAVYGGGYGVPEDGVSYNIYMGTVFGSTAVNIGDTENDASSDYIYIIGNIFGGGSQSRVYAETGNTAATVNISSAKSSNIALYGSVFGGGERGNSATTNASVPTTIGNVFVNITGNGASDPATIYFVNGGVYGDGNLCLVKGTRTITITNLITADTQSGTLKTFYSLQRADTATLSNSKIVLLGATDLVAEGDSTTYSINRIDTLNLTNGSTIKLDRIVNYLGKLTSDVYSDRAFVNQGYNGSNSYNSDDTSIKEATKYLSADEISSYRTSALEGNTVLSTGKKANTVCVANGLSLELRTTSGYGAVTGLFTLSLLNEVAGEGGGFVYASIADSTGDFICTTKFEDGKEYMEVADDVGGYEGDDPTYYYWFIAGSTINYTMEVTGYIGSDVTTYEDSGTVTRHSATRYYVLNSVSVESGNALETAIVTNSTYTLATSDSGLTEQQIAIEVKLGSASLGFLYYDSTAEKWGIYNTDANKTYYGGSDSDAADNILLSKVTVDSSNDTIYFVLHKSASVGTELSGMELTITIEIYSDNNGSIGNKVSGTTNKLVIAGTVNMARLGPSQAIYKTSGKVYAGVSEDSSINITAGSSFTVQYQTKYIPAAFSSSSGSMTWAITAAGYSYYMDENGNYMTLVTVGSDTSCFSLSSTLTYNGGTDGTDVKTVYSDGNNGYFYYTSYTDASNNEKVEMTLYTTFAASTIPEGTKITMIDLTGTSAAYYYYICDDDTSYIALSSFYKMGTTTTISELSSSPAFMAAYSNTASANTLVSENLIFIFDFEDVDYTDWNTTVGFSVQLQHIYTVTGASYGTDIMDYVQSPTETSPTYKRYTPTLTEYTILTDAGYTLSAEFSANEYYDLDTAELTVTITEDATYNDTTYINTRLSEYEYAIKIELVNSTSGTVYSFPVGMEFLYNGEKYAMAAGGTYVIIPVKTSGTHTIYITNELYSLLAAISDSNSKTAYFRVTLYSAPDANYYNNIEWGSATASYTIADNPTYALSVTTSITETDGEGNETVTTYSQVLTKSDTLRFWVKGTCDGSDTTVTVSLLKKDSDNGNYVSATLSDLFAESGYSNTITASSTAVECDWTISDSADEGTYRLVFTCGDRVEYLNVIVY